MIRTHGRPAVGALALLALVVGSGVGPLAPARVSADPGVIVTDGARSGAWTPDGSCVDASARLIAVGDGVFRCVGGVPVPRPQPWNADGCGSEVLTPASDGIVVRPWTAGACLIGAGAAPPVFGSAPEAGR